MQHVNRLRELNRIHRSVRSAGVILDQFPHARAHSFPWLGARRLLAILNSAQVIADGADHTPREVQQIPLRSTDPMERLLVGGRPWSHYTELGMKGSTPSFNGRDAGTLTAGQSKKSGSDPEPGTSEHQGLPPSPLAGDAAVAVADGDDDAVGLDDGVALAHASGLGRGDGVGALEREARLLVEGDDVAAAAGGGDAAVVEQRAEREGVDAALLHAGAGVAGGGHGARPSPG